MLNIFAGGGAGAGGWSLEPLNPNTYSYTNPKNGNIEISSGGGAGTPNASFSPSTGNNVSGNGSQGDYDGNADSCLLYTSPSPRDATLSRMPSSA